MNSVRAMLRSFAGDISGNIAMMFGLMLFVILGAVGIAIDLQRSNLIRTEIREAADAGLLAAAKYKNGNPSATMSDLNAVARKVFDNGLKNKSVVDINQFSLSFDAAKETFSLDVDGTIKTLILGVLGQTNLDVGAVSEAKLGKAPLLEIAMALDVTGSMNQKSKISTMRDAARDLVATMFESVNADVKIGVVPFAQYVNIGTKYGSESWLSNPGGAWNGCVGSRDYPLNTKDADYSSQKVPGLLSVPCPDALMPLSADESALDTMIGKLNPNGFTYIPAGLVWAWRLLTPSDPFSEGVSFEKLKEERGTKALILMTDGENTKAPDYPTHASADQILANNITKEICANIKADEIIVYTIAFDVTDFVIKDILENCATSKGHYFDAANSQDLIDAFAAIAASLRSISLSK